MYKCGLLIAVVCKVCCPLSFSQELIVPAVSPKLAALEKNLEKGPYDVSFADFDWQPTSTSAFPSNSAAWRERMPTQQAIDMFKQRAESRPNDYASKTILGELFLRKATEEDDLLAYSAAMDLLLDARRINPKYKPAILASAKVMMAQHQFADALKTIGGGVPDEHQSPAELALIVDCHLDMGNMAQARVALDLLSQLEKSPPVNARLARFAELAGDSQKAIQLIQSALETTRLGSAEESEWLWYQWRLAGLVYDSGDMDRAEALIQKVLENKPNDERANLLLAKIAFAKDQPDVSLKLLQQIVHSQPSPPALALLGDLYQYRNEPGNAKECWDKAEAIIRKEAVVAKDAHAREAAIFFADHNRHLKEARDLILLDRQQRQDSLTLDICAWISFKNDLLNQAKEEILQVLHRDSVELLSHYHAVKIYQALDHIDLAKLHLQKIVDVNPRFSILHATDIASLQSQWNLKQSR